MILKNKQIEKYLEESRITLFRLKSDIDVKTKALEYGYTEERIDEGIALYDSVKTTYSLLISQRGEQARISVTITEKFKEVTSRYSSLTEILKTTFAGDSELIKELGLTGGCERVRALFFIQAGNLFGSIVTKPHVLEKIAHLQITAESLQPSIDELVELQSLNERYVFIKGECQKLLLDRNEQLKKLKTYMSVLKKILTRLYKNENLQTLERLGIFVRNGKKQKKEEEPTTPPEPEPQPEPEQPEPEQPEPEPEGSRLIA